MESDINIFKEINSDLFHSLNNFFGNESYHSFILLIQRLLDSNSILLYLAIFTLAALFLLYKNRTDENNFQAYVITILTCFITFFSSGICLLFVLIIKNHAGVIRPFCQHDHLYRIDEIVNSLKCAQSFPSGHMSLAVSVIASFWSMLNRFFKFFAIIFLLIVGIARIAAGAHYPIDLLGAIIITLPTILALKNIISKFTQKLSAKFDLAKILWRFFKPS